VGRQGGRGRREICRHRMRKSLGETGRADSWKLWRQLGMMLTVNSEDDWDPYRISHGNIAEMVFYLTGPIVVNSLNGRNSADCCR
jgi:hypothetical protein